MNSSNEAKQSPGEGYGDISTVHLPSDRELTVIRTECRVAGKKKAEAEIIFWPEDGSFLVLTPEQAAALDAEAQEFDALSRQLERARRSGDKKQEEAVKEAVARKLEPLVHGPKAQDFTEIIRLNGGKWTYVRSDKVRNHWRRYPLDADDRERSIFQDQEKKPRKDGQRLTRLIRTEWPEIKTRITADLYARKAEVYGQAGLSRLPTADPELQKAFAGFDGFLEDLEKNYLSFHSDGTSPYFDVSGGAQLMRYYAGASFKNEVDLAKGRLNLEGEAKASFALFEGRVKSQAYFPHRDGHELRITNHERRTEESGPTEMSWAPCGHCEIPGPTFALDSSFVRPNAIPRLKQILGELISSPGALLQIVGHTDASGATSHNQILSERRARSVYAFLRSDASAWAELSYQEGWGPRIFKQILRQLGYCPATEVLNDVGGESYIRAVRTFQKSTPPLAPNGSMDPATRLALFDLYMRVCGSIDLPDEAFMSVPWLGRGETELADPTAEAREENRRVSFYLFNEDEVKGAPSAGKEKISVGHLRADLELAVFAFAGASVMGSANIEFSVKDGKAYLRGGKLKKPVKSVPQPVGGEFSALFGAKAGCEGKGKLQWRSCETDNKFEDLASIGYEGVGNAGVGLEANFKIRFEDLKFMIRVKAGVVLGLGCSGGLDFAVSVDYLYRFAVYVYTQLRENNFEFLEFIEDEAFQRLDQAVYFLITQGQYQLAAGVATGRALDSLCKEVTKIAYWWSSEAANLNAANEIVARIKNDPTMLKYTSPEVKGRLLHVLCHRNWRHLLSSKSWSLCGWYEDREEAAVKILELVQSQRDYQEVLEHMGFYEPKGENEKIRRRVESEARIMGLLDYEEDAWLREKKLSWPEKEMQVQKAKEWKRRLGLWKSALPLSSLSTERVRVTDAGVSHLRNSSIRSDTVV